MGESAGIGNDGSKAEEQKSWPLAIKIGFRFCFCYMMLYVFFNGNVTPVSVLDGASLMTGLIGKPLFFPFAKLSVFLGKRLFHLSGFAVTWHPGNSGDTALYWILTLSFLVISLLVTLFWSLLDHKRKNYDVLYAWLRFAIRIMLGVSMIFYALVKVFSFQMLPITLGQLNEPLGQLAPMTMLWSFMGMSPLYQTICGTAELVAGILILVRKTALAGALLIVFVMSNVLLYNLFFDVPVKIFSAHLVLLALFLVLPDVYPLWKFFVLHTPTVTAGVWVPQASSKALQRATSVFEICFLLLCLAVVVSHSDLRRLDS
jgi:preprotein translocase subunit SecG